MFLHPKLADVTQKIVERSKDSRAAYLTKITRAAQDGPRRAHLSCGNQAHAYAAMGDDKSTLLQERAPNIGIITAYNDMLSAHQPFETYPEQIKAAARTLGATAQVAAGVPAMCDGSHRGNPVWSSAYFHAIQSHWPPPLACRITRLTRRFSWAFVIKSFLAW